MCELVTQVVPLILRLLDNGDVYPKPLSEILSRTVRDKPYINQGRMLGFGYIIRPLLYPEDLPPLPAASPSRSRVP